MRPSLDIEGGPMLVRHTVRSLLIPIALTGLLGAGCRPAAGPEAATPPAVTPEHASRFVDPDPRETHFSRLHMLTDGGENAEAYFSFDGKRLIFQS
ncbi:MAG TPA: hypothetical protein ENK19_07010, partial [Acidobacteria bacterium]|nr:hypothetical protein [Acidobacteriota bacterium]